jgi:copper chaperone CopZ
MATSTYKVKGVTCGHCVQAVTSELQNIEGVTEVAVDLETGDVTVTSDSALKAEAVRSAVDEAGFELVS